MKRIVLLFTLALLVACQPSAGAIEQSIAETQAAMPTVTPVPTPTLIPLSEIDLSGIMYRDGELPTGYTPGQIRSERNGEIKRIQMQPVNEYNQELSFQGAKGGYISVVVFETVDEAQVVYEKIVEEYNDSSLSPFDVDGLGDYGIKKEYYLPGLMDSAIIAFRRCNTIVSATIEPSSSISGLVDYAKQLDKRLSILCR
jgi:hypothetical protein